MNYGIVFRLLGFIAGSLCLSFILCLGVEIYYSEIDYTQNWGLSIALSLLCSLLFFWGGRKAKVQLFRREALCVIGLGWILSSVLGALPYLTILHCSPVNALFESVSGLTTTGATVFADVESFPESLLFWRSLSQWIGGLGVVVFFAAILSSLGASSKLLFSKESSGHSMDLNSSRIQSGLIEIICFYILISLTCTFAFYSTGIGIFESICHMMTTVSTGGFSTRNASTAAFNNPTFEWLTILFMALGGTSILLFLKLYHKQFKSFFQNAEVKVYYGILISFSLAITWLLIRGKSLHFYELEPIFRKSLFQVTSIMTTTGFATDDFDRWPAGSHLLLLTLMLIGCCAGSTGGGLKVSRVIAGLKIGFNFLEKSFRVNVVRPIFLNGRYLDEEEIREIPIYILLALTLIVSGTLFLAMSDANISLTGNLSALYSCFFNVGPCLAEVGPTETYDLFSGASKFLLILYMLIGRLELYAILVFLLPSFWKRYD